MAMGKKIQDSIVNWGIVAIVIVVLSVLLLKFRDVDSVACQQGWVNTTLTNVVCCLNGTQPPTATAVANVSNLCAVNTTTLALRSDLSTWVTALSEPKNFVVIVIIGVIGFGLISLFRRKNS